MALLWAVHLVTRREAVGPVPWGWKGGGLAAGTDSGEEKKVMSEPSLVAWETGLFGGTPGELGTTASRPVSLKVVCDLEPATHHMAGLGFICKMKVAGPSSCVILC